MNMVDCRPGHAERYSKTSLLDTRLQTKRNTEKKLKKQSIVLDGGKTNLILPSQGTV
jgi:hypothetical protein